jgi:hypothetical protein
MANFPDPESNLKQVRRITVMLAPTPKTQELGDIVFWVRESWQGPLGAFMLVITVEGKSQQPWIRPLHQ